MPAGPYCETEHENWQKCVPHGTSPTTVLPVFLDAFATSSNLPDWRDRRRLHYRACLVPRGRRACPARRPGSVSVAAWTMTAPERLRRHAEPLAERLVRGSPKGGFPECVPIILITPKCLGHHPNGSQIFACVLPAAMATRGEDALFTFCTILTICRHGLMRSRGTICINCGSARCRQSSLEKCRAQGAVVYPRSSSAIPILRRCLTRRPRLPGCERDARRAHCRRQAANEPPPLCQDE